MTDNRPSETDTTPTMRRITRLLDAGDATDGDPDSILYLHTVMCQTGLPYRNPGDDVRVWDRINGGVHLRVRAGEAMHPEQGRLVDLGLPYGPKPRLLLAYLNAEALRQRSPVIEVEGSLTGFVRALNLDPKGRNIATIKDQLARLSGAHITLGIARDGEALTIKSDIISAFTLWWPKDDRQRVLWPSTVQLSPAYFDSLTRHAVPLHDRALMALSGSAMGLDVYAWLAQRLHRIEPGKRVFIPWPALQAQFGWHYDRLRKFREVFTATVRLVHSQYRAANIEVNQHGMALWHSLPPVKGRTSIIVRTP